MNMHDLINQFVEDLSEDVLFSWADIFSVEYDLKDWHDDEWPDRTDTLRTQVVEAMEVLCKRILMARKKLGDVALEQGMDVLAKALDTADNYKHRDKPARAGR